MIELRIPLDDDCGPLHRLLADAIACTARAHGAQVSLGADLALDESPQAVFLSLVQAPFDFSPLHRGAHASLLARTIMLLLEPPSVPWFDGIASHALRAGHALHVHPSGARELVRRGIAAEHFQLGCSPAWGDWRVADDSPRPIDVLYLGTPDPRNERTRAGWAPVLWPRRTRFAVPETLSHRTPQVDATLGSELRDLLRSARTIAILNHAERRHFQWPLALAAIANGCVPICEQALDADPLRPAEHYLTGRAADLALLACGLLDDERRLTRLRAAASSFVREQLSMDDSIARLLEIGETLAARAASGATQRPADGAGRQEQAQSAQESATAPAPERDGATPTPAQNSATAAPEREHAEKLTGTMKRLIGETIALRRRVAALEHRLRCDLPPDQPVLSWQSEAFAAADPLVSVIVTMWSSQGEIEDCLASVAASQLRDYEVLVLDDASADESAPRAQRVLAEHPWMASQLLVNPINCGCSQARNALIARARADLVFVLDADNMIYPTALGRLLEALRRDPAASFAYPMQAVLQGGRLRGVHNLWPWDPQRFVFANYIDAMALIRREALLEHGGYSRDGRLDSQEDHDLWCRMAERGQYGVHVPEMLATYRIQPHSKLRTLGGVENEQTLSLIHSRVPDLMRRLGGSASR